MSKMPPSFEPYVEEDEQPKKMPPSFEPYVETAPLLERQPTNPRRNLGRSMEETAQDTAMGAIEGASMGFSDELAGAQEALSGAGADVGGRAGGFLGDLVGQKELGQKLGRLVGGGLTGGAGGMAQAVTSQRELPKTMDEWRERLKTDYQLRRDVQRALQQMAAKRSPTANTLGNVGGGIGALALTGGGSALASLKGASAIGGATGLGYSEADLTKGDVGGAALDTGLGAGLGLGFGAAGKHVGGKLAAKTLKAREGVAQAADDIVSAATKKVQSAIDSAKGVLGKTHQEQMRAIEVLRMAAANGDEAAAKYLSDPKVQEAIAAAAKNYAKGFLGKQTAAATAREAYEQLLASKGDDIAAMVAEKSQLLNPAAKAAGRRLMNTYAWPLIGSTAGSIVGGGVGELVDAPVQGAVIGGTAGLALTGGGRLGVVLKNRLKDPAFRKWFFEKYGRLLQRGQTLNRQGSRAGERLSQKAVSDFRREGSR